MTKQERARVANIFIASIASCGRKFFTHADRTAHFEIDPRGRIWFVDDYSQKRIYTHDDQGRWRGFSHGGTMRDLVRTLRNYIQDGKAPKLNIGPWPGWYCAGDLWGYGEHMKIVRESALALGLTETAPAQHGKEVTGT
jgi:hypothetical protein